MIEEEKKPLNEDDSNQNQIPDLVIENKNKKSNEKMTFLEVLSKFSPGKHLRTALENIRGARDGALIVVDSPELKKVFNGGFRVNCKFTPQKLAELAKMDGAIILSSDLKRILVANTFLIPNSRIPSNETGTRHMAAERTSKQVVTLAIAVSGRRGKVTLFYDNMKYVLQDSELLLRRAAETLHLLEKQRDIYDDILTNLNVLEITNLVSVGDVCSILQRIEIISKMMETMKRYLIELGKEGILLQSRVREIFSGVDEVELNILKDYVEKPHLIKKFFASMSFDSLLNKEGLSRIIFQDSQDTQIYPKGFRILSKLNLNDREIKQMVDRFSTLNTILSTSDPELRDILKNKTHSFNQELEKLKEQIMMGKKI